MDKKYFIPHNYDNSGRVFNLFYKRDLTIALSIGLPMALIIFNLPLGFSTRCAAFVILTIPPMLVFLLGYGNWILNLISFYNNRKIYYKIQKGDRDEKYTFAYNCFSKQEE